jgi:hypothetical protein
MYHERCRNKAALLKSEKDPQRFRQIVRGEFISKAA